MFEIAGGILIALFVLFYLRGILIITAILIIACTTLALIYAFNLDDALITTRSILTNIPLLIIVSLVLLGHFQFKKSDKIKEKIQSNHKLLYRLKDLRTVCKT